jgi:hypothetical protein
MWGERTLPIWPPSPQDSVLRTELGELESQEDDAPKCVLRYKPMTWGDQVSSQGLQWDLFWQSLTNLWVVFLTLPILESRRPMTVRHSEQIDVLFYTTYKVKTQQVAKSQGHRCETSNLPPTWLTLWDRFPWFLTCSSYMRVGQVDLTLVVSI